MHDSIRISDTWAACGLGSFPGQVGLSIHKSFDTEYSIILTIILTCCSYKTFHWLVYNSDHKADQPGSL